MNLPMFSGTPFGQRLARVGIALSLMAALVLSLALPPAARAGGKPKVKERPPFLPPYTAINSVDVAKRTITVGQVNSTNRAVKTYTLSRLCEIEVKGEKAPITSLTPGMKVSVNAGMDPATADRISAGPAPTPPPSATSKAVGRQKTR